MSNLKQVLSNSQNKKNIKGYILWARVYQVITIITGVLSIPVGIISIIAGIKFDKAITTAKEINEDMDQDTYNLKTQEFIASSKNFFLLASVNSLVAIVATVIFITALFGVTIANLNINKQYDTGYPKMNYGTEKNTIDYENDFPTNPNTSPISSSSNMSSLYTSSSLIMSDIK